jgi:hypothetical protein
MQFTAGAGLLANPMRHSTLMYQAGSIREQAGYSNDRARSGQINTSAPHPQAAS